MNAISGVVFFIPSEGTVRPLIDVIHPLLNLQMRGNYVCLSDYIKVRGVGTLTQVRGRKVLHGAYVQQQHARHMYTCPLYLLKVREPGPLASLVPTPMKATPQECLTHLVTMRSMFSIYFRNNITSVELLLVA